MKFNFVLFLLLFGTTVFSQKQSIDINVQLNPKNNTLTLNQKIFFYNYSKDTLNSIYLYNWMNSYKGRNTPLSKRLLEDYDKSLYFAKEKDKGYTDIHHLNYDFKTIDSDILKINLNKNLNPKDSIKILINYTVKIPKDKFTKYGYHKDNYNLKYWYLTPMVYKNKWQLMHNFNMDDLYSKPIDYNINFTIPNNLILESSINNLETKNYQNTKTYKLSGDKQSDVEIVIEKNNDFTQFKTKYLIVSSNLTDFKIDKKLSNDIIKRQIIFIEDLLGKYPHKKILVNKIIYDKNPVYGLNQLPSILNPFNDLFKFDIQHLKALTNTYINTTLLSNRRKDYWLNDGIQTYLMIKYIEKYYPEVKAMGSISKIWGVRSYQLAKLSFNDKYAFVHQFSMRKNLDQSLNTSADSLSTFNRKIVNKYKAGLGFVYLNDYLGKSIIKNTIKEYYKKNILKINDKTPFKTILASKTKKDLTWFYEDYLKTNNKLDYTIKKVTTTKDSLIIDIKNKSDFTAPITIYGVKDKKIKYKKWISTISDYTKITIPKGDFDRISLNYEAKYPEINLNNNWKNLRPSLFNKPLQFRFMKDIDNPYYNQVFYNIEYDYNYYDGIILGLKLSNKTLFKKKWIYRIKPTYGFKNNEINGSFSGTYTLYPKHSKIYKFRSGINYSTYNYAPELSYQRISPYVSIDFKRKSLRDVGGESLLLRYLDINKEIHKDSIAKEEDNYGVLNLRYSYNKPDIIKNFYYNLDLQASKKFSKIAFEMQYRKLQKNNTQIDLRVYAGSFIYNNTTSGFFDYSLNRPSDYLFDYNYFGRSEETGFLSQQIIISEGGFKSFFKNNTANQWMITSNNSIGIWRWIELYSDIGLYKKSGLNAQFKYDSGIRFNFVQNFFEVYFPVQSSNGFEINQERYNEKIRFVLTLSIGRIYNFIKRGFY